MHAAEGTQMGLIKDKEGSENVLESEAKIQFPPTKARKPSIVCQIMDDKNKLEGGGGRPSEVKIGR